MCVAVCKTKRMVWLWKGIRGVIGWLFDKREGLNWNFDSAIRLTDIFAIDKSLDILLWIFLRKLIVRGVFQIQDWNCEEFVFLFFFFSLIHQIENNQIVENWALVKLIEKYFEKEIMIQESKKYLLIEKIQQLWWIQLLFK